MVDQSIIAIVSICATLVIAVGTWIINEIVRRQEEFRREREQLREAKITRLETQIQKLYGPLYARNMQGLASLDAFDKMYPETIGSSMYGATVKDNDDDETKEANMKLSAPVRAWMKNIFHPNNVEMVKLIQENTHLIEGGEMPNSFRDLYVYVTSSEALLDQWTQNDFSRLNPTSKFPTDLLNIDVKPVFTQLLKRKDKLLLHEDTEEGGYLNQRQYRLLGVLRHGNGVAMHNAQQMTADSEASEMDYSDYNSILNPPDR